MNTTMTVAWLFSVVVVFGGVCALAAELLEDIR